MTESNPNSQKQTDYTQTNIPINHTETDKTQNYLTIRSGEWDSSPPVPPCVYKPRSGEVKKDWTPET